MERGEAAICLLLRRRGGLCRRRGTARAPAHDPRGLGADAMNARIILAIPAAVSMALSVSTIGTHLFWQDSGVLLSAIREMVLVYAPGFIAYEVLCRLWSGLLFFIDFTLAVHLFSALCAALASGVLALAVRDQLRSRGPLF